MGSFCQSLDNHMAIENLKIKSKVAMKYFLSENDIAVIFDGLGREGWCGLFMNKLLESEGRVSC
jgi:hypothetical protein